MLFVPIKFKTYVQLTPAELDSRYQERIYDKLRSVYEGTCTKHGYIKPKSIEIVKRSCGNFIKQNFNGAIRFDIICRAEVCNPIQGTIVSAIIKNKNQLGILAESTMELDNQIIPILDIIIPIKSAGIISQVNLDTLSIGESISVEVMGKKYQMKDTKISIIGRVITAVKIEPVVITEEEDVVIEDDPYDPVDIPAGDDDDEDDKKKEETDDEDSEDEAGSEEEQEEVEEEFEGDEEEESVVIADDDY